MAAVLYHPSVEFLTTRERADCVFALCQDGRLDEARALVIEGDDPDLLFASGYTEYWFASVGRGSFEQAKDTLTLSARLFSERGDMERELLCNVYLGLCYSRQGQPREADTFIESALNAREDLTRYLAWLSKAVVLLDNDDWQSAMPFISLMEPLVESLPFSLKGRFYMQCGLAHILAKERDAGLEDYEQALDCFEAVENREFIARIHNNIAWQYIETDAKTAHLNIDPAITIHRRLRNSPELAQCLDTRALIFLEERNLVAAKKAIDEAIYLLEANDHKLRLPDFLITRGRILAESGLADEAQKSFLEAADIAELNDNTLTARKVYRSAIESLCRATGRNFNRLAASASATEFQKHEREQEREVFRKALEKTEGSLADAATNLGLARTTLIYRIDKHHHELSSLIRRKRRRSILRK